MNLISYKSCKKSLDFKPDIPWPKNWPAFAWEKTILSGFTHTDKPVLNFTSDDVKFLHLFHTCHPQLNFLEMGRLILKWEHRLPSACFSWERFFSFYGLNQNTDFLIQQLKVFASLPPAFQKWVNKKAVHLNELRVLHSLKTPNQMNFIFQWVTMHNLSHSSGIKALELGVELLLMGFKPDEILQSNLSPEKAIQKMEQKRKPLSLSEDQSRKNTLKRIIWPSHVTAQWHRKGDKAGVEIKIWCQNQKELEDRIKKILKCAPISW